MTEPGRGGANVLLVAINAKYIHTSLAVRCLKACAEQQGFSVGFAEYTINQPFDEILGGIYRSEATIVGLSCYIWNIALVRRLCMELKKLRPELRLILGGPEVSWRTADFLKSNPAVDFILRGEGELVLPRLLRVLEEGESLPDFPGAAYLADGKIRDEGPAPAFPLENLPFPYPDLDRLEGRLVYFESARGCPFSCGYCLSSLSAGVHFMPEELACSYLDVFLRHNTRLVKFVDRTFNCNPAHANAILRHLIERDNGRTGFHFEISADILDPSTIELVNTAREGLFQFEIGVQSTREETLRASGRISDGEKLFRKAALLRGSGNAHIHMDLIAGLPLEDYQSFGRSYDAVFSAAPDMLQLGFLKVLRGSAMEREAARYGLVWQDEPPYEILKTGCLDYGDVLRLKRIERLNETCYNSGRFRGSLQAVLEYFPSPFHFFEELSLWFEKRKLFDRGWGKYDPYLFLLAFVQEKSLENEKLVWWMRHDIFLRENAKGLPAPLSRSLFPQYREKIEAFYADKNNVETYLKQAGGSARAAWKKVRLEVYPFSVITGKPGETAVLYNYNEKDARGNAAAREAETFFRPFPAVGDVDKRQANPL